METVNQVIGAEPEVVRPLKLEHPLHSTEIKHVVAVVFGPAAMFLHYKRFFADEELCSPYDQGHIIPADCADISAALTRIKAQLSIRFDTWLDQRHAACDQYHRELNSPVARVRRVLGLRRHKPQPLPNGWRPEIARQHAEACHRAVSKELRDLHIPDVQTCAGPRVRAGDTLWVAEVTGCNFRMAPARVEQVYLRDYHGAPVLSLQCHLENCNLSPSTNDLQFCSEECFSDEFGETFFRSHRYGVRIYTSEAGARGHVLRHLHEARRSLNTLVPSVEAAPRFSLRLAAPRERRAT